MALRPSLHQRHTADPDRLTAPQHPLHHHTHCQHLLHTAHLHLSPPQRRLRRPRRARPCPLLHRVQVSVRTPRRLLTAHRPPTDPRQHHTAPPLALESTAPKAFRSTGPSTSAMSSWRLARRPDTDRPPRGISNGGHTTGRSLGTTRPVRRAPSACCCLIRLSSRIYRPSTSAQQGRTARDRRSS